MIIKNRSLLISHGNIEGRSVVLDIIEAGLVAPNPYKNVKKIVRLKDDKLIIGHPDYSQPVGQEPLVYELRDIRNIYVIGGGKAVQRQAQALEDILGELITEGHISVKKGEPILLKRIGVSHGGHPLPDEDSVDGAKRILELAQKAGKGDIVFWCQSGGSTALQALPAPGITLQDLREVYRILYFGAGASSPEANAVRNLIAVLNMKQPKYVRGATLIQLLTTERPTKLQAHLFKDLFEKQDHKDTYECAINVLKRHHVWDKIPASVRTFLRNADPTYLPPSYEELKQKPYYIFRVMGPEDMLNAAKIKAEEIGLNTTILATSLNDVEARPTGEILAAIGLEAEAFRRPLEPPCAFICGGEVVVPIGQETGFGGRNQELVLAAAPRLAGSKRIVIGSVDSDGTDGPTNVAGGIVDGYTMERINQAGFDLAEELNRHNSGAVLQALNDTILTGNTGTNVRDLRVILVAKTLPES